MKRPYEDIIHMPRHVSPARPRMPMRERAAQFSPFAALTGYEDALREAARAVEDHLELDEQAKAEINLKLNLLKLKLPEHPVIQVTYFVPDERKVGGSYRTISGAAKALLVEKKQIILEDELIIPVESIAELELLNIF